MSFKNVIWIPVVLLFVASSCNRKIKVVTPIPMPVPLELELDESEFEMTDIDTALIGSGQEIIPIEKKKFSVIEIVKEACYGGGCPVFEFSLLNDGIAFYSCKTGCQPKRGAYYAYLGKDKAAEILDYIQRYNMMQFNSIYPTNGRPVENIPLTKITLSIDENRKKEIRNYHHSPEILIQLEHMIGELIDNTNWEPTYE